MESHAGQNKLAYSGVQDLSISPDGPIGTPALQGSLSDPSTSAYIFFSEPSEDSSEPAERESGREAFLSFTDESVWYSKEKKVLTCVRFFLISISTYNLSY